MMNLLSSEKWHRDLICEARATKEAIISSYQEMINLTDRGNWLLFYFLGHGMQDIAFQTPNNIGNIQSYLVTFDASLQTGIENWKFKNDKFFCDNDLMNVTEQAFEKGLYVCNILDCCYGGGMNEILPATQGSNLQVFFAAAQPGVAVQLSADGSTEFYRNLYSAASAVSVYQDLENKLLAGKESVAQEKMPYTIVPDSLLGVKTVFKI